MKVYILWTATGFRFPGFCYELGKCIEVLRIEFWQTHEKIKSTLLEPENNKRNHCRVLVRVGATGAWAPGEI